jgi:GGDEF domain-containing protein
MERIKSHLAAANQNRAGLPLSLSLGMATGEKGARLIDVLREADQRMYQDKAQRKNLP